MPREDKIPWLWWAEIISSCTRASFNCAWLVGGDAQTVADRVRLREMMVACVEESGIDPAEQFATPNAANVRKAVAKFMRKLAEYLETQS